MNTEEAKVGCFQMVSVLLFGINYVIVAMSHALPVFHNYTPKFYCQMKDSTNKSYGCQTVKNSSIVANLTFASPEVLTSCSGEYRFETEFTENSVVIEWSLVCEKQYLSFLGPTAYYTGMLLGAWITGFLIDRIGRFPIQAICLYVQGTMAVALYIVQNYPTFLVLRGLQGVFVQGLQNSTYILSLELFPARSRTLVALIMQISWSIGLVLLAILSYVIPDWRILQLAVSIPTAITVLYIWIIPESPRWLLAKGKSTEADMTFERIAIYNNCYIRLRTKNISMHTEACVKSNTMLIKSERKSPRVTSDEFEKANENQREETTNLLNELELTEQKIIERTFLEDDSSNSKNKFSNEELCREVPSSAENFNKWHLPSNSKHDRESKIIIRSKCDQRNSLKDTEEVVLRKIKGEKTRSVNEETIGNNITKQIAVNKIQHSTFKSAIKSSRLRKYGAVMICQWWTFTIACGIFDDLTPTSFPINRHITFALGAILEIATNIFVYFVLSRYGRRLPLCTYQCLNGIICILIAVFFLIIAPWTDTAKTIMLLFGKVTITSTLSIVYLYTVEIFPTVVRGSCLGLCVAFAKIGSLSIPHLLLLMNRRRIALLPERWKKIVENGGNYLIKKHVSPIPLLVAGMLCLVSGVSVLILPETLNEILPDQVMMNMENVIGENDCKSDANIKDDMREENLTERQILRKKLFSENWVDAGNGILVNFTENKNTE